MHGLIITELVASQVTPSKITYQGHGNSDFSVRPEYCISAPRSNRRQVLVSVAEKETNIFIHSKLNSLIFWVDRVSMLAVPLSTFYIDHYPV